MYPIIILIIICVVVFIVSRKNCQNRISNLSLNFDEYNILIRKKYCRLSQDNKNRFVNSLNKDLYTFFDMEIIKNRPGKFKSTWSIQQKMMKQHEIMKCLSKF